MSEEKEKCTIILMSGDMDYVFAAFIVATTAAAMGMQLGEVLVSWR